MRPLLVLVLLCSSACGPELDPENYDQSCELHTECTAARYKVNSCKLMGLNNADYERYLEDFESLDFSNGVVTCDYDFFDLGCYDSTCVIIEENCSEVERFNQTCPYKTPDSRAWCNSDGEYEIEECWASTIQL